MIILIRKVTEMPREYCVTDLKDMLNEMHEICDQFDSCPRTCPRYHKCYNAIMFTTGWGRELETDIPAMKEWFGRNFS